jgi:oligoribonuclease (3'-5' exoribonuclease)
MPQLAAVFSHVIVDVSSIMALCVRWYPKGKLNLVAMDTILEMPSSGNSLYILASLWFHL